MNGKLEETTENMNVKGIAGEVKSPFVIAICSGKGGVGKSVLAINLALSLSGKSRKVLLWDADMQFPNLHLLMGVEPPVRLNDVYSGRVSALNALFEINENLSLLADLPATGSNEKYDSMVMVDAYSQIIRDTDFDIIIIDTAAGDSDEALQCSGFSDLVSVAITDEPTSLLDAYGLIKILTKFIDIERMALLVNNVIDYEDADEISRKLNLATKNFLNAELTVLGFVPYDRTVRQSILYQDPFIHSFPDSEPAKAVDKIADAINVKIGITNKSR